MKYSIENKGANLIIKNVNQFDIGAYECVARNQLGEAKSSTNLQVKQSFNNHPSEQNIEDIYTENDYQEIEEVKHEDNLVKSIYGKLKRINLVRNKY